MTNTSDTTEKSDLDNEEILATFGAYILLLKDIKKRNINIKELHKHDKRIVITLPIIDGIVSNLEVIGILIENYKTNEAFVIARSLIERIITFLYLQGCTNDEFEKYIKYTSQKIYRKSNQYFNVENSKFTVEEINAINLDEYPELQDALDTFTSKKSKREITRWSNTSLINKLEVVSDSSVVSESNINLILLYLNAYYDDASEAAHSTMYGCTFHFFGFSDSRKNVTDEEIKRDCNKQMRLLLYASALTSGIVIKYLGETYNITEINNVLKNLRKRMGALS